MARMIPIFFDDRTPPGERDVFRLLAAGPDDWVAIHSLDLAPWNRGLRTEIDFVVIVPQTGILCIEVKSHEEIDIDPQLWIPDGSSRTPIKQALDGRNVFRRRLLGLIDDFRSIPVLHMCIFPRAPLHLHLNMSVQAWELIDGTQFRSSGSAAEFCTLIENNMRMGITADKQIKSLVHPLDGSVVDRIIDCCVPVRLFRPDARDEIEATEHDASGLLREQQKPVLQLAMSNPRLLVEGPAGTGKTLIAMELARRMADRGHRVALLCYNQLVGDWICETMQQHGPSLPNLIIGRAIQIIARLADIEVPTDATSNFWEQDLPGQIREAFENHALVSEASFDYLVLDEAQDILCRPWLWSALSKLVSGGLQGGRFALFGDFSFQVLGDPVTVSEALENLNRFAHPVRWPLTENCRNYRLVAETALRLSGFENDVYSGFRRTGSSQDCYDIAFYSSAAEQAEEVRRLIGEFRAKGYRDDEIAILTFATGSSTLVDKLRAKGLEVSPAWKKDKRIFTSSVQAFKGMESKVVILSDLEGGNHDFHRNLFYTGMTRATESLRILCSTRFKNTLLDWLKYPEKS